MSIVLHTKSGGVGGMGGGGGGRRHGLAICVTIDCDDSRLACMVGLRICSGALGSVYLYN